MVCSDHVSAEVEEAFHLVESRQLGAEQLEGVVGALDDSVVEFEGEGDRVDGRDQLERGRVGEGDGSRS